MLNLEQIEKMTEDFIDLQIKELNEKEKRENEIIKKIYRNKAFIFENLNNNNIVFDFEIIENNLDEQEYYSCDIYAKFNEIFLFLIKDYTYEDYSKEIFLTLEEINKIKEYKRQKDKENQKEEFLEFEI